MRQAPGGLRCPGLTVGLVGGGGVRRCRPVDDGVGGEVGELRDRSQQTAGVFFWGGKAKNLFNKYAKPIETNQNTRRRSPFLFPR